MYTDVSEVLTAYMIISQKGIFQKAVILDDTVETMTLDNTVAKITSEITLL
jgi:hypothetical protein